MPIINSLILGIVQGLTEFFPISSSAHLIIMPHFFSWEVHSLVFDTSLHLGTAFAILLYFWKDWVNIIRDKSMLYLILVGSLPAGIVGFFGNDFIEGLFRSPILISAALLAGTTIMKISSIYSKNIKHKKDNVAIKDSLIIGSMQVLALVPGMSRSGMTISGGFFRNINREQSIKFSFYLAAPVVIGAGIFSLIKSYVENMNFAFLDSTFTVGASASFFVGLLAIHFLIKYINKYGFGVFIWYRLILVAAIWTIYFLK